MATSTWSLPSRETANDALTAVAASSAGVFATGYSAPGNIYQTVVLAMVRGTWRRVTSPSPSGAGNYLDAMSAAGSHVLAAGYGGFDNPVLAQTLVMHKAGSVFRLDTTPSPGGTLAHILEGVTTWRRSAWAVGQYNVVSGSISVSYSLILHWTGTRWVRMPSPNR